ncbi:SAM-dependent methyltransferase [Micromonospora sp. BRA006-A]|nr:SAM-dependent methyltransferase [Micromonospora sp. BRA006-A]
MIDYWLGGRHHRPVDVAAAAAFEAAYGPCAEIFRSLRGFLGRTVRAMTADGIDGFLVFGAGVPTCGNVHEVAPEATVLYTDVDPGRSGWAGACSTAATGPGTATATPPTSGPSTGAAAPVRAAGLGRRPVGVIFLGLAAFLDDDTLARTLDELYQAVAPGSRLAIDFDTEELAGHPEALAMMGPAFRMRAPERFAPLLGRWQPTGDGIVPVARWRPAGEPEPVPDAFHGALAVRPAR